MENTTRNTPYFYKKKKKLSFFFNAVQQWNNKTHSCDTKLNKSHKLLSESCLKHPSVLLLGISANLLPGYCMPKLHLPPVEVQGTQLAKNPPYKQVISFSISLAPLTDLQA